MSANDSLEFHVDLGDYETEIFNAGDYTTVEEAFKAAAKCAAAENSTCIDVVTWTKAAAKAWGGDYAVEEYKADPHAFVHDRLVFQDGAWVSTGRVA